jgi:hypothetical protein
MPVPPYGSIDEIGSDVASLILADYSVADSTDVVELTCEMSGLYSSTTYLYYLLPKEYTVGTIPSGWLLRGSFTTDPSGEAEFTYTVLVAEMSSQPYCSLWINKASAGKTILISDNIPTYLT